MRSYEMELIPKGDFLKANPGLYHLAILPNSTIWEKIEMASDEVKMIYPKLVKRDGKRAKIW